MLNHITNFESVYTIHKQIGSLFGVNRAIVGYIVKTLKLELNYSDNIDELLTFEEVNTHTYKPYRPN